jgi:hypothetical protein
MRYSVVLPRIETTDADGARRALDSAHDLWTKGEQRAALDQVRQAAQSANAIGQRDRALVLSRAVAMLARAIGSSSVPPPVVSEAPAVSAPRRKANPEVSSSADTEPPAPGAPARGGKPATPPAKPVGVVAKPVMSPTVPAPRPGTVSAAPTVSAPPMSARMPGISTPPGLGAVTAAMAVSVPPVSLATGATASMPAAALPDADTSTSGQMTAVAEDVDLVVTIAPSDWALPSPSALVGHSAQRVAVAPGRGPGGTLMVRPLAPGEVAPKGSIVAVMVALEPGPLPLPRAG